MVETNEGEPRDLDQAFSNEVAREKLSRKMQEARDSYKYKWWESTDPFELAWGQINEPVTIMDWSKFIDALDLVYDEYNQKFPETPWYERSRKFGMEGWKENVIADLRKMRPEEDLKRIIEKVAEEDPNAVLTE